MFPVNELITWQFFTFGVKQEENKKPWRVSCFKQYLLECPIFTLMLELYDSSIVRHFQFPVCVLLACFILLDTNILIFLFFSLKDVSMSSSKDSALGAVL